MGIAVRNMRKYKKQGHNLMINNTAEILKRIRAELNDIENEVKPVEPSKYPDNLMDGYMILGDGSISDAKRYICERYFLQGNWFATKAEAELEVRRRAVIQKMRAYGFVPDKDYVEQSVWLIDYDKESKLLGTDVWCQYIGYGLFSIYFESKEKAQECIDALGAEILEVL